MPHSHPALARPQANQGTPANGRRVHAVFPTFEFTKELVAFGGTQLNTGIGGRE
jgi:hypothetical protein